MTSDQVAGSTSGVGDIKLPKKGSANKSEAGSTFVASSHEDVFMSGALQDTDSEASVNPRAGSTFVASSHKDVFMSGALQDSEVSVNPRAGSTFVASSHEDVFMSGALQDSEVSVNPRAASQRSNGSDSLMLPIERSSLEALELAPSLADISLPENQEALSTALPDSIDERSDFSISLMSSVERSSLEALELAPSLAHAASPGNQEAISTALPQSTDGGSRQESLKVSSRSNGQATGQNLHVVPSLRTYASTIKILSSHLPHLRNVQERSLRKNVNVTSYDYADDALAAVIAFSQRGRSSKIRNAEGMSLGRYLRDPPSDNVQLRLIVASDLSTALIKCLGNSLSMSPEVYEEHLINSGWHNGAYNDEESDTWVTRGMKKSHMSIRWYRPVKRTLQQPYSTVDRRELMTSGTLPFSWTEAVPDEHGKPHGVKHQSRPKINILRRDWDMSTDAQAANSVGNFAAWEERATIWSKQKDRLLVVVVLLDPLPVVKDEMSGAAKILQRLGVHQAEPTATKRGALRDQAKNLATGSSPTDRPRMGLVKSSTILRSRRKADPFLSPRLVLELVFGTPQRTQTLFGNVGPPAQRPEASQDTEDPESGQLGTEHDKKSVSRPMNGSGVLKWLNRLMGRSEMKVETADRREALNIPEEEIGTEIKFLEPIDRCMFEGLYPRGPVVDYDLLMNAENADLLAEYLDRTKATAATFKEWLIHSDDRRSTMVGPASQLVCLFEIVHSDTMNTLRHMEFSLREIGQHILDDSLIQQRLVRWRHLLERFGTELQQLEDSLRTFALFINSSGPPHTVKTDDPERQSSPIEELLQDSVSQIKFVRQLTTRSHKSLMANMSIIESKRGIAEAESVTKLTELAFFFIPLTFSASIFSMQVKELNASRISIAAFLILATIITTASYALRLVIRSQKVIRGQRELLKNIRNDKDLALGVPVPTGLFIAWISRWVWGRFGILTIIVTFEVALLATLTAVLWTRELNHAFKILLTILLLTFILMATFVTAKAMLHIEGRSLRVRRDIFKPSDKARRRPYQTPFSITQTLTEIFPWLLSRSFLIGLAATAVAAGPAAALWNSQLTLGIKVGVTIVLGMLYVFTIVYLVTRTIQKKKPSVPAEDETN